MSDLVAGPVHRMWNDKTGYNEKNRDAVETLLRHTARGKDAVQSWLAGGAAQMEEADTKCRHPAQRIHCFVATIHPPRHELKQLAPECSTYRPVA